MSRQRPNDSRLCRSNLNMRRMCWLTKTRATIIWGLMTGVAVGLGLMIYWLMRPLAFPPTLRLAGHPKGGLPILTRLTNEDMEMEHVYRTVPLG